ncbi:MAG: hypothetical protein Q9195_008540 [Heterodermia aff. obscurata]
MLGRASNSGNPRYAGNARSYIREPAPMSLLGRRPGQGVHSMAPIREQSVVRNSLSERNMSQLNQSMRAMNMSPGVNIDINNNNNNNNRATSQSSVRRPQSDLQMVQQAQFNSQLGADGTMQQKRFVILSWTTIPRRLLGELCKVFQVQPSKVRGWLEEGLIRSDLQKWHQRVFPYDIELLTPQLTNKDIQKWDNFVRSYDGDRELRAAIGTGGRSYPRFEDGVGRGSPNAAPRQVRNRGYPGYEYMFDPDCPLCHIHGRYCGHIVDTSNPGVTVVWAQR